MTGHSLWRTDVSAARGVEQVFSGVLAQSTVSDPARAEEWYTRLFGTAPDSRPMPGLIEWQLGAGFGVQVWSERERAGRSSMVLQEGDLTAAASRLSDGGIAHDGPEEATSSRILRLVDPDGNRVVLVESH